MLRAIRRVEISFEKSVGGSERRRMDNDRLARPDPNLACANGNECDEQNCPQNMINVAENLMPLQHKRKGSLLMRFAPAQTVVAEWIKVKARANLKLKRACK